MAFGEIKFTKWNRDIGQFVYVIRKGRIYDLDGKRLELYPPRVFAEAINRVPQTLWDWNRRGLIPPPLYKVSGSRINWYSKWLILNAAHIYHSEFDRKNHLFNVQKFCDRLKGIWYETDYLPGVVDEANLVLVGKATGRVT